MTHTTTILFFLISSSLAAQSPCGQPQEMLKDGTIEWQMHGTQVRLAAKAEFNGNLIDPEDWRLESHWEILGGNPPFVMGNWNYWSIATPEGKAWHDLPANLSHFIIAVKVRPRHRFYAQCIGDWQQLPAIQLQRPQLTTIKYE